MSVPTANSLTINFYHNQYQYYHNPCTPNSSLIQAMLNMSTLSPNYQGKTFWELVYGLWQCQSSSPGWSSSNNLVAFLSYVPDHEFSGNASTLPRWSSQPDWGLGCLVASCSARWSRAPLPVNLSVLPVWSIFRAKSYKVCLFQCLAGNSRIMRSIIQPF